MRTIETGKAIVDIVAWPENRPWEGRYQTSSQIERGLCRLVLSPDVFHDAARANTAYRRFARKIEREGLMPPNIVFRHMVSRTSQNVFCILTTTESVFNSACSVGKFYVVESGIDERRRAERGDIGAQIAVGIERMDDGEHGALQLRLQRQALRLKLQMGRQVLAVGNGVPVGKIRLHVLRILARGGMPAGGEIVKQTHARRGSAFQCGIFQQSGIDIGLQLAYVQL